MTEAQLDEHVNALWSLLPRARRGAFYSALMENPNNEFFNDGPDDSGEGRTWAIALGDYAAPISSQPLTASINMLGLIPAKRKGLRDLMITMLHNKLEELDIANIPPMPQAGGRHHRRHRRSTRRRRVVRRRRGSQRR